MAEAFFNDRDAQRRLDRTFCSYEGVPYYIRYYNKETVSLYKTDDMLNRFMQVEYTSNKFSYEPMTLGYLNQENLKIAYYLERDTTRDQRYGIPIAHLRSDGFKIQIAKLNCKGTESMLLNKYPTLVEAKDMVIKEGWTSAGFHRNYALTNNLGILCRDVLIGKLVKDEFDQGYRVEYDHSLRRLSYYQRNFTNLFGTLLRDMK